MGYTDRGEEGGPRKPSLVDIGRVENIVGSKKTTTACRTRWGEVRSISRSSFPQQVTCRV